MALGVSLIGAVSSWALLFSTPPPSSPPLSLTELARLARGLPIANEEGPSRRVTAEPGAPDFEVDRPRSVLLTRLIATRDGFPPGVVRLEVGTSYRHRDGAQRLAREIRMYGPNGANPYLFDSLRLLVRRPDGRWTLMERTRPAPFIAWQRVSAGWILAGLALVLPIALLFANRIVRPIRRFATASARLGADAAAAPIPVEGPTEIVEAATAFNRMAERIRKHLAERTTTIAAVAHDLRTPLARLRFRLETAPEPLRARAIADIDEMEAMIAATLRLVRDEVAAGPTERIELAPLLAALVTGYREQGAKVALDVDGPLAIEGEAGAVRRMIENLVNNALRFGGGAEIAARRDGRQVRVEVADRGPGLDEAALARAFDPFWRAEASRNRGTGGAGLGLTIVQAIARRHGGDVRLANRLGGGLVATVTLPETVGALPEPA